MADPWAVVEEEKPKSDPWAVVSFGVDAPKPPKTEDPWNVVATGLEIEKQTPKPSAPIDPWAVVPEEVDAPPLNGLAAKASELVKSGAKALIPGIPASVEDTVKAGASPFAPKAVLDNPTAQRVAGDVGAGLAGTAAGMVGFVPLLTEKAGVGEGIGRRAEAFSRKLGEIGQSLAPEEQNFVDKVVQGAASSATFLVPGIGIARGARAVQSLGPLAVKLAPYLGTAASSMLEAGAEAGGQFMDLLGEGVPREEAAQRADANFWGNALILAVTNKAGGLFDPGTMTRVVSALRSAPLEGIQEAGQSVLEDFTAGREIDWRKALESAGVGAIVGGTAGALTGGVTPGTALETGGQGQGGGSGQEAPLSATDLQGRSVPPGLPEAQIRLSGETLETPRNEQGGMPVHPAFQGKAPVYVPSVPYSKSISEHPNFVKFFADNDALVRKYGDFLKRDLTPEFARNVGQEIHEDFRAIYTGATPEAKAAAREALGKKYAGLDLAEVAGHIGHLKNLGQAIALQETAAKASSFLGVSERYVNGVLDKYTSSPKPGIEAQTIQPKPGQNLQAGHVPVGDLPKIKQLFERWFRTDRGAGPVIDRLNDERLGKIMESAFDSGATGKRVAQYIKANDSGAVGEAVYGYLTGRGSIESIPQEIRADAAKMRADVDSISSQVSKFGTSSEKLQGVIQNNIGKYLGRYYRLFESKKAGKVYRPSPEVIERAKAKLREMSPGTLGKLSDEEMNGLIAKVLDKGDTSFFRGDRKINVPQNHFIKRKKIPKEIRDLYGEITDPAWAYLKTVADQSVIAHNGEFLHKIKDIPGAFYDRPLSDKYKQIPNTKAWGPIAGKYTDADLHGFLIQQLDPVDSPFFRFIDRYVTNPFKWTKTVASLPSHPRNFMGNTMFAMLAGNSPTNPLNFPYYKKALDIMFGKDGKYQAEWKALLKNRVVGGQYWGTEVPKMLKEMISDPVSYADHVLEVAGRPIDWLGNLYNNEDIIYRISSYLKNIDQGMTPEKAAVKVDRYFTNYDKLPRVSQAIRKVAALGPFFSFKSNTVRIIHNAAQDAIAEAKEGNPTKAVTLAFALSIPSLLAKVSKEIFDVDDDDVTKLESYMAPYRRNGSMIYYRDNMGRIHAFDLAYIWPSGEFERAGRSLLRGDWEAFANSMDFFSHPVLDAWSIAFQNVDPYSKRDVANINDPAIKQIKDKATAIMRAIYVPASSPIPNMTAAAQGKLEPGILTGYQIKSLIDAHNQITDRYGRTKELPEELRGFATGIRTWKVHPEVVVQSYLQRKKGEIMGEKQGMRSWFKSNQSASEKAKQDRRDLFQARAEKISADVRDAQSFLKRIKSTGVRHEN